MGRQELVHQLEQGFQELLQAIQGLSDEAATRVWYGSWSVRDIIAHIAGWHREMAAALERVARGERPAPEGVDYSDADAWNARFAQAYAQTPWPLVLQELRASKDALLAAARQVPEERFEEGRVAYRILHNAAIDHYREHIPAILEWRRREGL
ncbi:MAG TPA: ClbS/DfsB family four-helix bundle protein [Dehalococcoidia bacterium]|nr:ClbS/DfsB family four-helix bundle protein [Dehalococcoidia bacterium]